MAKPTHANQGLRFDQAFIKKLEYLYIVSKKIVVGRQYARRKTKIVGSGIEFADFRPYAPGDNLHSIDWNIYARTERLFLKLYEEQEEHHIYFLIDSSRSMQLGKSEGQETKWFYAKRVTAALGYIGLANQDIVSIIPFSTKLEKRLPPTKGKGQIFKLLQFLDNAEPGEQTSLYDAIKTFVKETKKRGIAVVISDFYDPKGFEEGLNLLRFHRFEPIIIQLVDERDEHPRINGEIELVDCETDAVTTLVINQTLLNKYREALKAFDLELETFARAKQLLHFKAPIQFPFDDLILRVFRAGGFVD